MWHYGSRPPLGWTGADNDRVLNITSVWPWCSCFHPSPCRFYSIRATQVTGLIVFTSDIWPAVLEKTCSVCKYYEWWAGFPHWTWDRNNRNSSISRVSSVGRGGAGRGLCQSAQTHRLQLSQVQYNTIHRTHSTRQVPGLQGANCTVYSPH